MEWNNLANTLQYLTQQNAEVELPPLAAQGALWPIMSYYFIGGSGTMSGGIGLCGAKRHRESALRVRRYDLLQPSDVVGVVGG